MRHQNRIYGNDFKLDGVNSIFPKGGGKTRIQYKGQSLKGSQFSNSRTFLSFKIHQRERDENTKKRICAWVRREEKRIEEEENTKHSQSEAWDYMNELMTVADASATSSSSSSISTAAPSSSSFSSSSHLISNLPLVSAFFAFALAQFLKVFTNWFKEKRWDSKRMFGSGGMPSSHSATVTALAVAIGFEDGVGKSTFALAVVLAAVVMYDATGVRLHAGRQAEVLNQIVCELPTEHPLSNVRPLRELLGHTPLQVVAGALLGCMVSFLMRSTG